MGVSVGMCVMCVMLGASLLKQALSIDEARFHAAAMHVVRSYAPRRRQGYGTRGSCEGAGEPQGCNRAQDQPITPHHRRQIYNIEGTRTL